MANTGAIGCLESCRVVKFAVLRRSWSQFPVVEGSCLLKLSDFNLCDLDVVDIILLRPCLHEAHTQHISFL